MTHLGKSLILFGILIIAVGAVFMFGGKLSWFGRLPGDIYIQKKNFTLFFPVTTSIILSILISLAMILLRRR
ncbi:MAG: DUF2905 domain-containing protein [Candidatus Omnitrophota bacterium]|nr:DUF2905 domain-containing protein [Candidatus Omnitrophota bacterium]